jgi:hypothetical protein
VLPIISPNFCDSSFSFEVFKCCNLDKKFLTVVQLMPDFLPMNKIEIVISSFDIHKRIYIPKPKNIISNEKMEHGIEQDPVPFLNVTKTMVNQSYFGCCKTPVKMDDRIIESGRKVLQMKSKRELEKQEKADRDEIKQTLGHLKQQLETNIEKLNKS